MKERGRRVSKWRKRGRASHRAKVRQQVNTKAFICPLYRFSYSLARVEKVSPPASLCSWSSLALTSCPPRLGVLSPRARLAIRLGVVISPRARLPSVLVLLLALAHALPSVLVLLLALARVLPSVLVFLVVLSPR